MAGSLREMWSDDGCNTMNSEIGIHAVSRRCDGSDIQSPHIAALQIYDASRAFQALQTESYTISPETQQTVHIRTLANA